MAKRGFFAEINYQAQQAEKRRRQQEALAVRAHSAAVRDHDEVRRARPHRDADRVAAPQGSR